MGAVEIHGVKFTPKRRTLGLELSLADLSEELDAARDRWAATSMRLDHTTERLNAIGQDTTTPFDQDTVDLLHRERAALRKRLREANAEINRVQMQLVHARLENPPVDVDWLIDNLVWPSDVDRIFGVSPDGTEADGDVPPTPSVEGSSST